MRDHRNEKSGKKGLLLCGSFVLMMALGVSVVGGCFRGVRLAPTRNVIMQETVMADSALYLPGNSLDPTELYNRALRQTVYLSWETFDTKSEQTGMVSGAGIILSQDGYILTNAHCVSGANEDEREITVELYDGREFIAEVICADVETDIALLKIEASGLSAAQIGSVQSVKPCQQVYVMGHPAEELKFTITSGIISGLDREITFEDGTSLRMFQLDAAVNPGNSGGPVYNAQGFVIGMTTAKYVDMNTEGIGFAIPMEAAVRTAEDLREYGFVRGRPLMGITVQNAAPGTHREDAPGGARVFIIEEGLCGEKAGLKKGDIIIGMDEHEITCMQDLMDVKTLYRAFETVILKVWRNGEVLELPLTFDEATPEHPTGTVTLTEEELQEAEAGGETETAPETEDTSD